MVKRPVGVPTTQERMELGDSQIRRLNIFVERGPLAVIPYRTGGERPRQRGGRNMDTRAIPRSAERRRKGSDTMPRYGPYKKVKNADARVRERKKKGYKTRKRKVQRGYYVYYWK
jgi:hypothetical protein